MAKATLRQETSRKASRDKAQMKRRQTIKRRCVLIGGGAGLLIVAASVWGLLSSDVLSRAADSVGGLRDRMTAASGFELRYVELSGRTKTDRAALRDAIGLPQHASIFADSPEAIRQRLEQVATVRHAEVTRILPDTLQIRIEERSPIALWQKNGAQHVVDADGVVLAGESPEKYPNLLVVVGNDAAQKLPGLFALLNAEPTLAPQVTAAVRVGERRWDLRLKNDVKIMLPEENPAQALRQLAEWQSEKQILDKAVAAIDFRLKERTFVRTIPEEKNDPKKTPSQDI